MRRIPYYILDVFTDSPLGGNPLAVFPDRSRLAESELQKVAAEMNLSETVFVQDAQEEGALKRLRIFTPKSELRLAGHPVIGTWFLFASRSLLDWEAAERDGLCYVVKHDELPDKVIFRHELGAGVFPVTFFRDRGEVGGVVMDQDQPEFGEPLAADVETVAAAVSLDKGSITGSFSMPMIVSTGVPVLIVPLGTRNDLSACQVDMVAYQELRKKHKFMGIYAFTRDATVDTEMAFVSARGFYPEEGIPEDPATGSAAGCLGAYLVQNNILQPKQTVAFQIEQGVDMGRPSRIGVELTMAEGKIERVRVGGSAVVVAEGTLLLP